MDFVDNFIQGLFIGLVRLVLGAALLITPLYLAFKWKEFDDSEKRRSCVTYAVWIVAYFATPFIIHRLLGMSLVTGAIVLAVFYAVLWIAFQLSITALAARGDQALKDLHDIANRARKDKDNY